WLHGVRARCVAPARFVSLAPCSAWRERPKPALDFRLVGRVVFRFHRTTIGGPPGGVKSASRRDGLHRFVRKCHGVLVRPCGRRRPVSACLPVNKWTASPHFDGPPVHDRTYVLSGHSRIRLGSISALDGPIPARRLLRVPTPLPRRHNARSPL